MSFSPSGTYKYCGSIYTIWGYKDTVSTNRYFRIQKTGLGVNFYATVIKIGLLFVDEWPSYAGIHIVTSTGS